VLIAMRSLSVLALLVACRGDAPPKPPPMLAMTFAMDGADPATLEHDVVERVEGAVAGLRDVKSIVSRIEANHATVLLELAPNSDVMTVTHDVRHALANIDAQLPRDLEPPVITRAAPDEKPVMWLAVRGQVPIGELSNFTHDVVRPRLERLAGVAGVELHGLAEMAVVVRPDLQRMLAAQVTVFDLQAAVQASAVDVPGGRIDARGASIRVVDGGTNLDSLGDLVVRQLNGAPVRVRDIATIEVGFERDVGSAQPAIAIRAQTDANKRAILRAVRDELAQNVPAHIQITEVASQPGAQVERPPPSLLVTLRGPELGTLRTHADALVADLAKAGVRDVVIDPPAGEPERTFSTDRARAADLQIPTADIVATLRALGGAHAGTATIDNRRHDVVIRLPAEESTFQSLFVRTQHGALVPISDVVQVTMGTSQTIMRRDRERAIALSIYGPPAVAKQVVSKVALPVGYRITSSSAMHR
jgi:multidrug efflux pump subunit AcrB